MVRGMMASSLHINYLYAVFMPEVQYSQTEVKPMLGLLVDGRAEVK